MSDSQGFNVDLSDVYKGMAAMKKRLGSLAPVFRALRTPLRAEQKEHDQQAKGPDGQWAPRAKSTARKRLVTNRHRRKLNRSLKAARAIALGKLKVKRRNLVAKKLLGRLPIATTYTVRATSLTATSRVPWSLAQQQGGDVGRGHRSKLPARPFLWMSDRIINLAGEAIDTAVAEAWGEGK